MTPKTFRRATYAYFIMLMLSAMPSLGTVIRVPQDMSSITSAISSSRDGDTIIVSPGEYFENIDLMSKNITVASLFLITGDKQYVSQTIIRGDSTLPNSTVTISGGQSLSTALCGFTVTGGHGKKVDNFYMGGGIFVRHSSPIIRCNLITFNVVSTSCATRGGGISIKDTSNPSIVGNIIVSNTAGGLCDCICYFGGGIWIDSTSNPVIGGSYSNANSIYSNDADRGRQIYLEGNSAIVDAQYNYWGGGGPDSSALFPYSQFNVSHWLSNPATVREVDNRYLSKQFYLHQNFPNPFNPSTTIQFWLSHSGFTQLDVFNLLGERVATLVRGYLSSGEHEITLEGRNLANGVYYYRLQSGPYSETKRLLLIK